MQSTISYIATFVAGAATAVTIWAGVHQYLHETRDINPGSEFPAIWAERLSGKKVQSWYDDEQFEKKIQYMVQKNSFRTWLLRQGIQLTTEEVERITAD